MPPELSTLKAKWIPSRTDPSERN